MILFESNEILEFLQNNQEQNTGHQNKHWLEAMLLTPLIQEGQRKQQGEEKKKLIANSVIYQKEHHQQRPGALYFTFAPIRFWGAEGAH